MAYRGFDLSGTVAFVTGASRGIGRAIALGLAESGADLCQIAAYTQIPHTAHRSPPAPGAWASGRNELRPYTCPPRRRGTRWAG